MSQVTADLPHTTPPLRRRMACWLYEGVLLFGVVFVADLLFSVITQTKHGLENRPEQQAFLFIVLGVYFTWFWIHGQTLPMRTWHIKIVTADDGLSPRPARALRRYLFSWLWFLPPLAVSRLLNLQGMDMGGVLLAWITLWAGLTWLHPQRQFWHDAWAGTRLVVAPQMQKKIHEPSD